MSIIRNELPFFPIIMGPTASGKSSLAIQMAEYFHGEIISADSMQIYRGLNIGTAKPTQEEQCRIPHHLIDIIDITERYDVFRFVAEAEKLILKIRTQNHLPIVAGGTGLYLRALLYGLDPMPADLTLRHHLDQMYDNEENYPALCALMEKEDPEDFCKFKSNRRKLLRAREVFLLSHTPMTELQERWKQTPARSDAKSFVLVWDPAELRKRIEKRCQDMLNAGWIDEAEHFLHNGLHNAPTAWQVLGYREIAAYLRGEFSRTELKDKIVTSTWHFARRQNTWFRTQHPEAVKLNMPDPMAIKTICRICQITD